MTERIEPVTGLRDYFHDLARVAPADEQLASVLTRTADVAQRPAWRTRLPRLATVEAIGRSFPVRYALIAAATLALAWSVGAIGGAGRSAFEGQWTSTDADGSTQLMDIAGGNAPAVRFEDLRASGCQANGDDSVDFVARGIGIVSGERLVVDFANGGGCHTWQVPRFTVTLTLDRSTGTLRDADGLVWRRAP